jgi:putative colanic acid biosynthesis acetyltransferase WcaF
MKQVNNASYKTTIDIGASRPKQWLWYFVNVIFFKNPLNIFSSSKVLLLKLFGAKLGKGIVIKPSVNIKYPWKLVAGDDTWIGEKVWIDYRRGRCYLPETMIILRLLLILF